jgi:hypothetical protein
MQQVVEDRITIDHVDSLIWFKPRAQVLRNGAPSILPKRSWLDGSKIDVFGADEQVRIGLLTEEQQ